MLLYRWRISKNWISILFFFHSLKFINYSIFKQAHQKTFVRTRPMENTPTQKTHNNSLLVLITLDHYVNCVLQLWFTNKNVIDVWDRLTLAPLQNQKLNQPKEIPEQQELQSLRVLNVSIRKTKFVKWQPFPSTNL